MAVKMPASYPRDLPVPWDTDPILRSLRRGVDTDVVVAEVRETSRKPDEVYGVIERFVRFGARLTLAVPGRLLILTDSLAPKGRKLGGLLRFV